MAFWLPLALGGSALLSLLGKKKEADAQKSALEQENANRAAYEAAAKAFLQQHGGELNAPTTMTGSTTGWQDSTTTGQRRYVGWDPSKGTAADQDVYLKLKKLSESPAITEEMLNQQRAIVAGQGERERVATTNALNRMNIAPGSIQAATAVMPGDQRRAENIAQQEISAALANRGAAESGTAALNQALIQRGGENTRQQTTGQYGSNTTSSQYDPLRSLQFQWGLMQPQGKVSTNTGFNPWLSGGSDLLGALSQWYMNKGKTPFKTTWDPRWGTQEGE